ncbi:hypothetical protein FB567DRAFT_129426 [Paraphoma chrysanthemicola]|uniref:Uncharacterized protein n=1 Tax=Paraphoma chrysanthemicola TaxID=798071 RepID=A0A8K0VVA6_9PLEO|nr:hypothetical protein FB567DRAFT_129426 [Paraphoma chrysanthemicola]
MSQVGLPDFGPTCPSGGQWWACSTGTYFVGCCARNPCSITCPQGDLYPAGFDPAYHAKFPDAECGSGVSFYTCIAGNTFLGCCKSNPCSASGCPRSDVSPTFLNTEALRIAYGAISAPSPSSAASSRTLSTAISSATGSPTSTRDAAVNVAPVKNGPPVAAIAGGAAGGALALAVIVGLLIYYFCHAKKSRKDHEETVIRRESDLPAMMAAQAKNPGADPYDAPPGYKSPNPNDYYAANSPYHSYAHHHQMQYPPTPEPQELPIEPLSPVNFSRKAGGHQRNLSELSGDTTLRSELETPVGTPRGKSQFSSPMSSPEIGTMSDWQSPVNPHHGPAKRTWTRDEVWHE